MKIVCSVLLCLLMCLPLCAQSTPDAPSFLYDALTVTGVNLLVHAPALGLDAQSTNVGVNFAKCCVESHTLLYGRYPSIGRLTGVMAIEFGLNDAYTTWMWRETRGMPKRYRVPLVFSSSFVLAGLHYYAGFTNQKLCNSVTPGKCSLLRH